MALQILKFLLNYKLYNTYSNNLEFIFNTKELKLLYNYLSNLINKYERDISVEEFCLFVLINIPEKDKQLYADILKEFREVSTESLVVQDIITEAKKQQIAYDIAIAALEVSEGRKDFSDLLVLTDNLNATKSDSDSSESLFVTDDLEVLYNESIQKQGLRWRLETLNRMLGSLRTGDFGFIFARPETGKTTFLASEVTNFATQTSRPVLWFNNEEQGTKVYLRLYQAMLGCTLTELFQDVKRNKQRYMELGGSNIKLFDSASLHRKQVEQLVRDLEPGLVVIDQIDKVKGFTDDREDLRLGAIYIWAREIAKQYCPVIAVCQADASGEGKKWLTMENVANAKTAKQAEADWILGIGKTHSVAEEYMRHLALCKNKLTGDADTDPNLRHGRETVKIRPDIARYVDV